MKIGIIGAGFTGLTAGLFLSEHGHDVQIFEKDKEAGGLAVGYREPGWDWSLEQHYHHWFTNDATILNLAAKIRYPVRIVRPKTSVYIAGKIYQLDSPAKLLTFSKLSVYERFRMAAVLGLLRYDPVWKPLEAIHASTFLSGTMGRKGYELIWEPQLRNKFGKYKDEISLAWFWARIKKRTSSLAYPEKGFLAFANNLISKMKENNGTVQFNTEILEIKDQGKPVLATKDENGKQKEHAFDALIVTLPSYHFIRIAPQLPASYKHRISGLKGLGAINVILRLKHQFLTDNTYWLSVCDSPSPVMAIVEHTNFMDKKYYGNEHIVYLGNYLPSDHPYFKKDGEALLREYDSLLRKIRPAYGREIIGMKVFKAPFAQPIIPLHYSNMIPPFETPLENVYLANMQQVYPWDRGTNYAVELGEKVSKLAVK